MTWGLSQSKKSVPLFLALSSLVLPAAAFAQSACDPGPNYKAPTGIMAGVSDLCGKCGTCQVSDFFVVGNNVTRIILGLSGSILLLMVIYGGFLMLISAGNSSRIDQAKKIMMSAVIGIVIVFVAYTAVEFIMAALGVSNVAEVFKRPFSGK